MAAVNNCRLHEYQGGIKRFPVPEDKVSWQVDWPEYSPVDYTAPIVLSMPVWADPDYRLVAAEIFVLLGLCVGRKHLLSVQF